jgi:hypothetical protein
MEPFFSLIIVSIVFFAMGSLLGLWVARRRVKAVGGKSVIATEGRRQPAMTTEPQTVQPVMTAEAQAASAVQSKLDQVSAGINFLVNHFKIEKEVTEYGSSIMDAYDNFMMGISDEFEALEQRKVEGPEYHFRSNRLLFSLMMARVYMRLYGSEASLRKLESYIERAKKLV